MKETLPRRPIETLSQGNPTTIYIRLHLLTQPFFVCLRHQTDIEPTGSAQRGHHQLVECIVRSECLLLERAVRLIPPATRTIKTMGSGTKSEVRRTVPVTAVVLRSKSRTAEIGDLILFKPFLCKIFTESLILPHHLILVGQHHPTLLHLHCQRRTGFHRQSIGRYMIYQT